LNKGIKYLTCPYYTMLDTHTHSDIYELIGKNLEGSISSHEELKLNTLLETKENQQLFRDLETIWKTPQLHTIDVDTEKALSEITNRITKNKPSKIYQWIAVAATLLIVMGGYFLFNSENVSDSLTIVTNQQNTNELILTDGSAIKLNKNSSLTYPKSFKEKSREVTLRGEGYFSIARDESKPFIVHTQFTDIKVLGTSFYIKVNEGKVEVTVESGKVMVLNKQNSKQFVTLTKGENASFDSKSSSFKDMTLDQNQLFWKTKTLSFNRTSFQEVVLTLNQYYDDTLLIDSSLFNSNLTLTTTFKNQSIIEIANIISATLDISISESKDKIILKKTNSN
jgi:transmembrane sensor